MSLDFGIFNPVFELSPHGYLSLLHLESADTKSVITCVKQCCNSGQNPYMDIGRLLENNNWRPHLVAAVALSIIDHQNDVFDKLWRRFDTGSWVTPQLAVAAFIRDPNFCDNVRSRMKSRCAIDVSELIAMSPIERHVATGPQGITGRSAKAASSLVRLMQLLPNKPSWFQTELSLPDLIALLAKDEDGSAEITADWYSKLKSILDSGI